jgi:hypothetical protein
MIILYLVLAIIGGLLLGYAMHDTLWRTKNKIIGELYCFYHYKILREPEPDLQEIISRMIPATFAAMIGMKLGNDMMREYEKIIIESKKGGSI